VGEHSKHKKFSFGWVIGGTAIMFLTNLFGGFVAGAGDITGMWTIVGIALAAFALGGFVIGWHSEGQTILEAGLAAVLCLVVTIVIWNGSLPSDPQVLAIELGLPFLAALLGGWIGEKVQGDVIVTEDD
jgi:hypothetical protein